MAALVAFVPGTHEADPREPWTAYLEEAGENLKREFGVEEDIPAVVVDTLQHFDRFMPSAGRLVPVEEGGVILSCGCLRAITPGAADG